MIDKLKQDIVNCMKNKDKERLTTLREIKGSMDLEHINKKVEITEELLIEVVSKQIKLRNESIKEFEKGNRQDLIDKTNNELNILKEYLPQQLSEEEINIIIDMAFEKIKPTSAKEMGLIMKEVTPKVKGKADMGYVSNIIKSKLN